MKPLWLYFIIGLKVIYSSNEEMKAVGYLIDKIGLHMAEMLMFETVKT